MTQIQNSRPISAPRQLRFASVDDVLLDIDLIVQAHHDGRLQPIGQWTAGQNLAHVAAWIEYGYSGYPIGPPPWPVRMIIRSMLGRYLKNGMPHGVRIPRTPHGTFGQDDMPIEAAAERLKAAFMRLKRREPCAFHSPAFGPMSDEKREQLNLRHAELHLSNLTF